MTFRSLIGCIALALILETAVAQTVPEQWTDTIYVQFPDEPTARAAATAIGAVFDADGNPTSGNAYYALAAPIIEWVRRPTWGTDGSGRPVITDPGQARPGYWAMMRFNLATDVGATAYAQIMATGAVQTLTDPSNVFQ